VKYELRYLTNPELQNWDSLVERSPQGTVFCYSWWLNAIGGDVRVLGCFDKERLVAGIPLYFVKRFGIRIVTMPKLTQTWGVIIEPLSGKRVKVSSLEMEILRLFAGELRKFAYFTQLFSHHSQNWLPFYWNGFKQTTRLTYVIDDLTSMDEIWKGLRENIRSDIRKAQKLGVRIQPSSLDEAFPVFEKTFHRQNLHLRYTREYLDRIYRAAHCGNAGECFIAMGTDGQVHAAAFLVWDQRKAYYLVGGGDPDLRNSGATSLLIWELIQFSSKRSKVFDFEGSMIEPIEKFFRAFGASQLTYHMVYKRPILFEIIQIISGSMLLRRATRGKIDHV
jgi:hypothetical protein